MKRSYHTGISRSFRVRHFLRGDFGDESVPHSHPYRIEWVCRSPGLDQNGFAVDIARMEHSLEALLARLDDVLLNDLPYFRERQPSLENLASYLLDQLEAHTPAGVEERTIRIWESETAWASATDGP